MFITPKLEILTTMEWGASAAKQNPEILSYTGKPSVVHHMDWPNRELITDRAKARSKAIELAKRCQQDHFANGWIDTGQHFTNTREGILLEGRHGSISTCHSGKAIVKGAHAADSSVPCNFNDHWGIENEGTYITDEMPKPQWESLTLLLAWISLCSKDDTNLIIGHRDTGCKTACPGEWLHSQLPRLRSDAHAKKLLLIEFFKKNQELEKNK